MLIPGGTLALILQAKFLCPPRKQFVPIVSSRGLAILARAWCARRRGPAPGDPIGLCRNRNGQPQVCPGVSYCRLALAPRGDHCRLVSGSAAGVRHGRAGNNGRAYGLSPVLDAIGVRYAADPGSLCQHVRASLPGAGSLAANRRPCPPLGMMFMFSLSGMRSRTAPGRSGWRHNGHHHWGIAAAGLAGPCPFSHGEAGSLPPASSGSDHLQLLAAFPDDARLPAALARG